MVLAHEFFDALPINVFQVRPRPPFHPAVLIRGLRRKPKKAGVKYSSTSILPRPHPRHPASRSRFPANHRRYPRYYPARLRGSRRSP